MKTGRSAPLALTICLAVLSVAASIDDFKRHDVRTRRMADRRVRPMGPVSSSSALKALESCDEVRSYLIEERDFDPTDAESRALAPVSERSSSERGTLGNQVAMWLVPLPLGEESPRERLAVIRDETLELKATNQALGAATLVGLSSGAPITLLSLATRLAAGVRPFNMTVTNVPGPQMPLYLLESRLLAQYPLVPLWHQHGLGIAIFSYDGRMDWGLNADWDLVPDLDPFVAHLERAFVELREGARDKASGTA